MHMISKKDLSDAEMETLTKSCSPTIVITANGEVQTHEEATVYVKELDIFLTMKILENTPAVVVARKVLRWKLIFLGMDQWSKTTSHQKHGIGIPCSTENFVPIVVPGLSSSSSGSSSTSKTPSRQESHSSSSSSTSSSSPTVSEIQTRAREDEDRTESDISPVTVSTTVDERSGRPYIDQANKKTQKPIKKEPEREQGDPLFTSSEVPEWLCKNSEKFGGWWNSRTWRLSRQFLSWSIFRAHSL